MKQISRRKFIGDIVKGALGVTATLTGCASSSLNKEFGEREKIAKILGTHPSFITQINGYSMHQETEMGLNNLAGILAGTVKVKKTQNGYIATGSYSRYLNPEAMNMVLKLADRNKDKIITWDEEKLVKGYMYQKYAE